MGFKGFDLLLAEAEPFMFSPVFSGCEALAASWCLGPPDSSLGQFFSRAPMIPAS